LQPLYNVPTTQDARGSGELSANFYKGITRIEECVPPHEFEIAFFPDKFDPKTAGMLARSCAVVWVCDNAPNFSGMTAENMALLMGSTTNIDRLLSTTTLRLSAETAVDPFVKLILQTLLRAHSSATKDNYNFKEQFQRYVKDFHGGDILSFMERVKELDRNVVYYFIALLDETLLSQMPFLMESSEAIYETRAQLLEWYADVGGDDTTRMKAKELRLDRKIASVRGAINEARLNIDSVRFRQWIEQNQLTEFSTFVRQSVPAIPGLNDVADKTKIQSMFLSAHREPAIRALFSIVECYAEFCRNPDYGIASFLGRRIRHGTLKGTLLNGINDQNEIAIPPSVSTQYQSWTRDFSAEINRFSERLHFQDKAANKNGIISAEVDSTKKWQACLVCLNSIFEQSQQDYGVTNIPKIIEQYCWFVFEYELETLRGKIADARSQWGTLKLRHSWSDTDIIAFERSINITLNDRFSTVLSWFRKPPNISPIAEINHVIEVVLKEAKDEYATFSPDFEFVGKTDLQLSGAIYYIIYDALTIAVRNAAKHGRHPGKLTIETAVVDVGPNEVLDIAVTSELLEGDTIDKALNRIEIAGNGGARDADIVEGLSGIRKLKKMESERSILSYNVSRCDLFGKNLRVEIRFPFKGLVE
jgi:hypothetical protein